ncbi:MAG TPA: hypothetical protein VM580_33350 [Labilithrix sp.]|nr:hypothetical protein [Labilithrix sp.]
MQLSRRLKRDSKGAVLAEFCIAIVPVLTTFLSFVQLSRVATARLVVKHSAIIGARAAAVISNANDNNPGQYIGSHDDDISNAVKAALGPWQEAGGIQAVNVTVNDTSSRGDPYNWVEVKVSATYACKIPMGVIACGGSTKLLEETYRMPHQGARYR